MTALLESYLSALAANLTAMMLQVAGSKTAAKLGKPKHQKSLEQCIHNGMAALLSKSTDSSEETTHKLMDCFGDFFKHDAVVRELSKLLRGKQPDIEELGILFEDDANWDRATLPGLEFEQGMQAFIAAFLESAVFDSKLSDVIQAGQLIRQTDIQQDILVEMRELAAFFREQERRVIGIQAGEIRAKNVVNGQLVIHQVVPVETEARRAETEEVHYLKTLVGFCDQLDLATVDEMVGAGEFICLSDVFTSLNLAGITRKLGQKPEQTVRDAVMNPKGERHKEFEDRVPVQAIEAVSALPRLVILGHPGGGKSTLVNYLTVQLARRRLAGSEKSDPLPGLEAADTPLPVRITLRRLAAEMTGKETTGKAGMIWDFLKKRLAEDGCGRFYDTLEGILKEEGGVIFFDGLDEVLQQENDPRRTRIKEAIEAFSKPLDKCRIIVTSRVYAYKKSDEWQLPPDIFPDVMLDGFSLEQIEIFTRLWYAIIGPKKGWRDDTKEKYAADLYEAIETQPHLEELGRYPLLLTLMAQVHGAIGYLPDSRADLYERAVNLLLAHWDNRIVREIDGEVQLKKGLIMRLGVKLETLRSALERVAFAAHEKQEQEKDRTEECAYIPMQDLLVELDKELKSWDRAKTVIEYIHERAGLLQASEEFKTYAFPHRTFQEFLSAAHIMKKSDFHTLLRERIRRDRVWWREVFLLAAGYSRKYPMYISNLVSALVPKEPGEEDTAAVQTEKAHDVRLAARALVETDFFRHVEKEREDESGLYSATYERVQSWLIQSLLSKDTLEVEERVEAGQLLGLIGDPRLSVITLSHMEFCLVPEGAFYMGSKEENDYKSRYMNEHINYDYWISRHPITNAQYEEFVIAGGYTKRHFWSVAEEAGFWSELGFKGFGDDDYRTEPIFFAFPFYLPNHPVVGVSWYEALAFTRWLTDVWHQEGLISENWKIRLPSEAEWEKAALGGIEIPQPPVIAVACENGWNRKTTCIPNPEPKWIFPWGNQIDNEKANYDDTSIGSTSAVGCFSAGVSRYGCLDMAGNVWEWMQSAYEKYPYDPSDGREDLNRDLSRVLMGGAFSTPSVYLRCASRRRGIPHFRLNYIGFRCVCAPN